MDDPARVAIFNAIELIEYLIKRFPQYVVEYIFSSNEGTQFGVELV